MLKAHPYAAPKLLFILATILLLAPGISFSAPNQDTLSYAKQLNSKNEYRASVRLLKPYYLAHPGNLSTQWIYGQTLYAHKNYKQFKAVYENAIKWHPENYYLRLDYAKKLTDIGDIDQALPTLNLYLKYDSTATDVHNTLAKIYMWKGEYQLAIKELDKTFKKDPKNIAARALREEILAAQSSWIKLDAGYYTDNQPMQKINCGQEAGVYLHPLSTLHFALQAPVLLGNGKVYNVEWLRAGNIFHFKTNTVLEVGAGAIKLPNNNISWTGKVELNQTLAKHLLITAKAEHKAYLYALANLTDPVMYLHYQFAVAWTDKNSWQGQAAFDADQFYNDKNVVYTGSAWFLTPPLKASVFEFRIGYGYNFSTSQSNRFASTSTVSQVVANWDSTTKINGAYVPYFTPNMQSVNMAILSITIHPDKVVEIGLKGNIGFYATASVPYLYLNKNAADSTIIARSFSKQVFVPGEANAYVAVQISPRVNLKAEYKFFDTLFYISHYAGLSLQINFWNEKRK
jgi:tetratricopeptide (TPR) repeat protein